MKLDITVVMIPHFCLLPTWGNNNFISFSKYCVKVQDMMLCISMMYGMYVCSPMLIPRQLRFSLYSGAAITEGRCSLFTSLL